MLPEYLYVLLLQLCWVSIGLADPSPTITIPWVADAPDFFKGYGGKVLDEKDESTTYAINCLADAHTCRQFTPDLTIIYGPSTYDMTAKGARFDLSSGCTLIGSPSPTGATCIETKHSHKDDSFLTTTVVVPATGTDSTLGIYPATLPVTDTGSLPVPSDATGTQAPVIPTSTTRDGRLTVIATPISVSSNDREVFTATGSLVLATSAASAGYLNATVTAASVGAPATNGTLHVAANGTVTVTMTVLASDIACHCACDCRSASSQAPLPTGPPVVKNHAAKTAAPVALMGGLLVGAMFLN